MNLFYSLLFVPVDAFSELYLSREEEIWDSVLNIFIIKIYNQYDFRSDRRIAFSLSIFFL